MTPDNELLRHYAESRSEDAFAELVRRYINLVYSAALRQVGQDAHLAQDVAQTVFTDLARKAASLSRRESLTGWLYSATHFAAGKMVRTEKRRREREEKFMREPTHDTDPNADWGKLRPILDAAMHGLKETDREAVLLRYFENRPYAEVGAKLGVNENTARMRVERALEKLRALLARRGLAAGTALASVISANAIQIAPDYLGATLTSASIAGTAAGALPLTKILAATKLQLGLGALVAAGAVTAFVIQHQAQYALQANNDALSQQLAQLKSDNADLSNRVYAGREAQAATDDQFAELLKLRAEVTALRTTNRGAPVTTAAVTNELPPTNKFVINLKAKFILMAPGNMPVLSSGWAPAGSGASLISEGQLQSINQSLKESAQMRVLSAPQVTTFSGTPADFSEVTMVPLNGTNVKVGLNFNVTPFYSPDSSVFTLNLAAQLHGGNDNSSSPGVLTTTISNQVTLFPGQSVVFQADLPAGSLLEESPGRSVGPKNLLVVVTPKLGGADQNTAPAQGTISQEEAMQKMNDARQGVLALLMYAQDNRGQFPPDLAQASKYLKDDQLGGLETNFDLLYSGPEAGVTHPAKTIVLKEKQAWLSPAGTWMKSYGFADGHSELHTEPNGDFAEYEKNHTVSPPANQ